MVRAILNDSLDNVTFRTDPVFGFEVPVTVPGCTDELLEPRNTWADKEAYDRKYAELAEKYRKNFVQFRDLVSPEIAACGPK